MKAKIIALLLVAACGGMDMDYKPREWQWVCPEGWTMEVKVSDNAFSGPSHHRFCISPDHTQIENAERVLVEIDD